MGDVLLNKIINSEVDVNIFLKWLVKSQLPDKKLKEIMSCNASQTEFITYFLNLVHEEIPCNNKYADTPPKANTPKRIQQPKSQENDKVTFKKRTNLFATKADTLTGSLLPLNKSIDDGQLNSSHSFHSSTPKNVLHQTNISNKSYVSPLYRNKSSFLTPTKENVSCERFSPVCLGDFFVTKKSSTKKKNKSFEENKISKRINPTVVSQKKVVSDFRTTENSFNFQNNCEEIPVENAVQQRSILAKERIKILSRRDSVSENQRKVSLRNTFQLQSDVEPNLKEVTNKPHLDCVVNIYVTILHNKFVLNITSEIYFLISLLLNKQINLNESDKDCESESTENLGVSVLNKDSVNSSVNLFMCDEKSHAKKRLCSSELFQTIHNVVYFSIKCLESQIEVLKYYDKSALKLLAENQRLNSFSPSLGQKLHYISDKKSERILEITSCDLQKNVCFNSDTDNRENFPNDLSFHAFRKQRDMFYEILRIWENNYMFPGWSFSSMELSGKIKMLFSLSSEPANFIHFSRLFKGQLLSTCVNNQEERLSENQLPFISSLADVDTEKLNRLKSRLVTKQSSIGINSVPVFTGYQEFYKDFIIVASNYMFYKHLSDSLISDIIELNETKFSCTELEDEDSGIDPNSRKLFLNCVKSLRVLAKFLGFVESLPNRSECNYSKNLLASQIKIRQKITPPLDIKKLLQNSLKENTVILIIPWITKYLSMLDYVTLRLPYYISVYNILFELYRNSSEKSVNYNNSMITFCLGWLFELPQFPDTEYFNFCSNNIGIINQQNGISTGKMRLDKMNIVDQNILYICCPFLEEIKKLLSSNASGSTVTVKHITPVTAVQSCHEIVQKKIEQQLEESFFNGQPASLRKTVEFVSERIASTSVKHICNGVVPELKKSALEEYRKYIKEWANEHFTDKERHKILLKANANKISRSNFEQLQDKCEKEMNKIAQEKIPPSIENLLPIDVLPQTANVCVSIATKMCIERVTQWISSHITVGIFSKEFDNEIKKIPTEILSSESSDSRVESLKKIGQPKPAFVLPPSGKDVKQNENALSGFHLLDKIKNDCCKILERDTNITQEYVANILKQTYMSLTERTEFNELLTANVCQIIVELALLLITHNSDIMTDESILSKFVEIWNCYYGDKGNLFKRLICPRNLKLLSKANDVEKSWEAFAKFIAFLTSKHILTRDCFEGQCTGFFKQDWDKEILTNFTSFMNKFVLYYKSYGGNLDESTFLLQFSL